VWFNFPLQSATISAIGCMGLLNVGVQLALAEQGLAAGGALALSAVCGGFVLFSFRRVRRLDLFEKAVRTGTKYEPNA
jgi:hypothetical protein